MNEGILTASGIASWLSGQKKIVREWDRAAINTAQAAKVILFKNTSEGDSIVNSAVFAGGAITATRADTSMKSEGKFQHENFVATHLALEFENQVVDTTACAGDLLPTVADVKEFNARAWFSLYFEANNLPHDEGQYVDFPSGRGMTGFVTSTADSAAANQHSNGNPDGSARQVLKSPYRCTANTKPRLEIEFLQGAVGLSVDGSLRAFIFGVEGL